jgi:hypothetical protein
VDGRANREFAGRIAARGDLHSPTNVGARGVRSRRRAGAHPFRARRRQPIRTRMRSV